MEVKPQSRPSIKSNEQLIAQIRQIARAIVQTLGESLCEVLVHDFAQPDNSIVLIEGKVTNRKPGGSMSQIGLAMMAEADDAKERINYVTRTRDGKVLKSSTVPLYDEDGRVVGAFCINVDITGVVALDNVLKDLLNSDGDRVLTNIHFGNDTAEVAQVLLEEVSQELNLSGPPRDLAACLEFVHALDRRGFFGIRYSVPLLADYLGVSRATIYNYLEKSRAS